MVSALTNLKCINSDLIPEMRFNSGIKQSKLPQVPHFRYDRSPPRRLLVRFDLLKSKVRTTGDGKVHVSANENIAASAGKISFLGKTEDVSSKGGTVFSMSESSGRVT
jgi:hypothetical protein